jgi:hypothetical protein
MTTTRRVVLSVWILTAVAGCRRPPDEEVRFGVKETVAPGVDLYRLSDASLVEHVGPIAISLLRLDPARVQLSGALSNGEVLQAETVDAIAARSGAIAAVNGGFFNRDNGEPTGLLKVAGELVSDNSMPRGAVVIERSNGRPTLTFDQLAAKVIMTFKAGGQEWTLPIDGVDTTRARGKLMLYTPAYHADTDTAPTGTEWVLDGKPLRVVDVQTNFGHTRIPRNGAVLSFGGTELPDALAALVEDVRVSFRTTWKTERGLPAALFDDAEDIINGAGLLRRDGAVLTDWKTEGLAPEEFIEVRHPRTLIGADQHGFIWLAAVDGRQPDYSIGMTFKDLQRLCDRLDLSNALNLDGGGSTTMVVKGHVVNRPSDAGGLRPVSDAIVVTAP